MSPAMFRCAPAPPLLSSSAQQCEQPELSQWNWGFQPSRAGARKQLASISLTSTTNSSTSLQPCKPRVQRTRRRHDANRLPLASAHLTQAQPASPQQESLQGSHSLPPAQTVDQGQCSNTINSLKLLTAGACSALVSRTFVAPLERVKMEQVLQQGTGGALTTARGILQHEGLTGFWRGNMLNVLRTAPFKAVNFFCFDTYHRALVLLSGKDGNKERFTSGAMAGITATIVCFPLDVVRTRLMARAHGLRYGANPFHTLAGIMKYEGVSALYTGCVPAIIGMAPAGAVFYGVYDLLKKRHLHDLEAQGCVSPTIPFGYTLLYGALAGASSEIIVYPLEVLRRRMQVQSMMVSARSMPHLPPGGRAAAAAAAAHHAAVRRASALQQVGAARGLERVLQTFMNIVAAEGFRGLYAGMGPNILQVLPSAALSYFTYDSVKQLLKAET